MRYQSGIRLVAAMEAEEEIAAVAASNKVGKHAESVETDLLEVGTAETEIDNEEKKTEEAVNVMNALESLVVALEASIEHGGISKDAAVTLSVATDYMYSKVGITKKSIPALESFGNEVTRIQATSIAIEGFIDSIKKIWDAIVKGLKKSVEFIVNVFKRIFGINRKLKDRVETIEEKIKNSSGSDEKINPYVKEKPTIDKKFLISNLSIDGKFPTSFAHTLFDYQKTISFIINDVNKEIVTGFENIVDQLGKNHSLNLKETFKIGKYNLTGLKESSTKSNFEDIVNYDSELMLGNNYVNVTVPKNELVGQAAIDNVRNIKISLEYKTVTESTVIEEIPVLNKQDCLTVLSIVKKIIDMVEKAEDYKFNFHVVDSIIIFGNNARDGILNHVDSSTDPAAIEISNNKRVIVDILRGIHYGVNNFMPKYLSRITEINTFITQYVELSQLSNNPK